jgi:poly-gamma-glutamate capsule biosynthesis protein CapA/YwtB (metallophosphatase superfamily)
VRVYGRRSDARARHRIAVALAFVVVAGCSEGGALENSTAPTTAVASPSSTTSTVETTTTSTTTTTAPPPRQVRLLFTGDSMAHDAVIASGRRNGAAVGAPYDFAPMWQQLAPLVSAADFAMCHLETTLAAGDAAPTGFPRFRAPREYATAIAGAGYDGCSTASNHAFDYGIEGVTQTIDVLQQSGLGWAGSARTPEEAAQPRTFTAAGVQLAFISATYGLNGFRLPADQPWLVDPIDVPHILDQARAARAAGAEVVVVSLHCCVEYRTQPTDAQVDTARVLLESPDIDLVVGHHAHVVQPIEKIGAEYALYGLGNILSNMYQSRCCPASSQDGVAVEVTFTEGADGRFVTGAVSYTPTWVDRAAGHVIVPVVAALRDPAVPADRRAALEASLARTIDAINSRGAADAGVALAG